MLWTTRGAVLLVTAALVTNLAATAADASNPHHQQKASPKQKNRQQAAPITIPTTTPAGSPAEADSSSTVDRSTHYDRTFDTPVAPPLTKGENIARTALAYRGVPYRFGGRSAQSGFDCSGLVQTVCAKWGIYLPRVAGAQFTRGVRIKPAQLQPGDLVFFQGTYKRGLSHVGIFIGEGHFVHAAGYGKGVRISTLADPYYQHHWAGAKRLDLNALPKARYEPAFTAREVQIDSPEEAQVPNARPTADSRVASPIAKESKSSHAGRTNPERFVEHPAPQSILEETTTTGPREVGPGLR